MKSNLYYYNLFKEIDVPEELFMYLPEQVYEDEELERHASVARMMLDLEYQNILEPKKFWCDRIKLLTRIAYENYSTYRKIYDQNGFHPNQINTFDDIKLIPYITKKDLVDVYQEATANQLINIHHESSTTGTQEAALKLINDIDSHNRSLIHIFQMYENMMGEKLNPEDWIYSIYDEPQLLTSILGNYRIFTIGIDVPLEIAAQHIRKLRPKVVSGYASRIIELTSYLPDAKEIGIKLFTTNSEYSSSYERYIISNKLGVPILDEYSSEELLIMGWEKECGKYYAPQDFTYVEFVNMDQEELLTVVGTNMWDLTMPRIRYIQGDCVEKSYCKNGKTYFENLIGKENCLIIKGKKISPIVIMKIIDKILLKREWVTDYQLVQEKDNKLFFYYCVGKAGSMDLKEEEIIKCELRAELRGIFLGENIEFVKSDQILRKSNKKSYFVRRV